MARLTVPDESTFAEFTVTTPTTVFPIAFALNAKEDLTVLVDDVALLQSDFTFSGDLLEGGGFKGGMVTLNTAVDDVAVRIERNVPIRRASNFAPSNSVPVGSVDGALNRLTMQQQDLNRKGALALSTANSALAAASSVYDFSVLPRLSVPTIAVLKLLLPGLVTSVWVEEDGRQGVFVWASGDQSDLVSADVRNGVSAAPAVASSGGLGCWKRNYNGGVWLDWFGAGKGVPADDQAAWDGAVAFADATGISPIWLEPKDYWQTEAWVLYAPGLKLKGAGAKYDWWGGAQVGTRLLTSGAGNPKRYTDIDGLDPADDTPQIVYGANATTVEDLTLDTRGASPWSAGLFVAGVRQCGFRNVQAFGHTDGCLYLDATWSSTNTTLTTLHPLIKSDSGPLEFTGDGSIYFRGGGADGFAVKIQGTTRPYTATPWVWAPGGASDFKIGKGRLGSDASVGGGAIAVDGQLPGSASTFIQGFDFGGVDFRTSSGRYHCKFDRCNRVTINTVYSEVSGGGAGEFAVTSRTQTSRDGILIVGDGLNSGSVTVDGVAVSGSGAETLAWEKTRCVTRIRADGRIFTPGITSSVSNLDLNLKSFSTAGQISFGYDDGATVTNYAVMNNTLFRPLTAGGMNLGSTSFPFGIANARDYRASPSSGTILVSGGVVTAVGMDLVVDTEGGAATDDLDTINGLGDGSMLVVRQAAASRDVTLKDGTGNLRLAGDFTFGNANDRIMLMRSGGVWFEISRSLNG